jgi:hypothetical protein
MAGEQGKACPLSDVTPELAIARGKASRTAILVLGMHRSGTSSFARVMNLLGADLPNDLMLAGVGNDKGHWESKAIVAFNERLLATAGSRWNDWLPIDDAWRQSAVYPDFFVHAQELLRSEYDTSPLFVLKDPRICRLAPFWLEVIESLDIRPAIVLPQRNPLEVSASLAARNASQAGAGLLLWLRHVLEAERATRGRARQFFGFEQLLDDWQQVASDFEAVTGLRMPRRSVLASGEIDGFLTPQARHQRAHARDVQSASMPAWVRDTHAIMLRWCDQGEKPDDFARLDAIRTAFDAAAPSFAQIVARGIDMGEGFATASTHRQELDEAHGQLADKTAEAAYLATERDERGAEIARLAAELTARSTDAERLAVERDERGAEIARLAAELTARSTDAERLAVERDERETEIARLAAELTARSTDAERLAVERDERGAEIARLLAQASKNAAEALRFSGDLEQARALLSSSEREHMGRQAELESSVRQRQEEALQAWSQAAEQRGRAEGLREQMGHVRDQNERLIAQLLEIEDRIRQSTEDSTEMRRALEDARNTIAQRDEGLARERERAERFRGESVHFRQKAEGREEQVRSLLKKLEASASPEERTRLLGRVEEAESTAREAASQLADRDGEVARLGQEIARWAGDVKQLGDEIVGLQQSSAAADRKAQWLREVALVLHDNPRKWQFFSGLSREEFERQLIERNCLFDSAIYLARYPDVREAGVDPLTHFIRHGIDEGRSWQA